MGSNSSTTFEKTLSMAISMPGVKVDRNVFLATVFKKVDDEKMRTILAEGPIAAGCTRGELKKLANNLVNNRTLQSSGISFAAGLPGGAAMAATIPADVIQFFAMALRLAQEISYIYGAEDLWANDTLDDEKVTNQLVLYLGVMFSAGGAAATLKILSSKLSQQALTKLPQQALTKTLIYPIVKQIAKFIGVKMTKDAFAKGVSKAIPLVGGFVSGGITYVSMKPMGRRFVRTLDEASFGYTADEQQRDIEIIVDTTVEEKPTGVLSEEEVQINKLKKYKELVDAGILSEEEFQKIKARYLTQFLSEEGA